MERPAPDSEILWKYFLCVAFRRTFEAPPPSRPLHSWTLNSGGRIKYEEGRKKGRTKPNRRRSERSSTGPSLLQERGGEKEKEASFLLGEKSDRRPSCYDTQTKSILESSALYVDQRRQSFHMIKEFCSC